tara:strand:- start:53 stop:283 length:231 start_codon:yes stop_codon:yes gene_type:complete
LEILPVVYEVPVAKDDPPTDAAYHLTSPALAVALSAAVPPDIVVLFDEAVIVGRAMTEALTVVLGLEVHDPSSASA